MRKVSIFLLSLMLLLNFTACGNNEESNNSTETTTNEAKVSNENEESSTESVDASEFSAEQPIFLTTVGQSADVEMVKAMLDNIGLDYEMDNLAEAGSLGDAKTLLLVVGGSSKGLGAAGIDENAELERVNGLIEEAQGNGLTIIAMHVGGEARRGDLSDAFIEPSFENADFGIVVAEGDSDGMMQGIADDQGYPLVNINSMGDVTEVLENVFQ